RDRRAQVVAAIDQHDPGDGQPVSVVERMIVFTIATPPPLAETAGDIWAALRGLNKARFIGLRSAALPKPGYLDVLREKVVGPREFAAFSIAERVPDLEPLVLPAALHSLFADQATRTVEPRMTAAGAERVMQVLDWLRQLPPTMWIAAVMAE